MSLQSQQAAFGPNLAASIAVLSDLGVSRSAIARYFRVRPEDLPNVQPSSRIDLDERHDRQMELEFPTE